MICFVCKEFCPDLTPNVRQRYPDGSLSEPFLICHDCAQAFDEDDTEEETVDGFIVLKAEEDGENEHYQAIDSNW